MRGAALLFTGCHSRSLPGYDGAYQQLNRMGKLLIIFDGFDEMAQSAEL
jgi:predicted NACHT family NTPase